MVGPDHRHPHEGDAHSVDDHCPPPRLRHYADVLLIGRELGRLHLVGGGGAAPLPAHPAHLSLLHLLPLRGQGGRRTAAKTEQVPVNLFI